MSKSESSVEPGYFSMDIDPGKAERLVLRFPDGELIVLPSDNDKINLELELRGNAQHLHSWRPSIRASEGILVIADEPFDDVVAKVARIRVPPIFRDIEAHSSSGSIEIRGLPADLLANTDSGDIRVFKAAAVEAASAEGRIEIECSSSVNAKLSTGALQCRDISGSVNAETQSGDISLETVGGNVVVTSSAGDISVLKPGGRLRVVGGSGDVELEIAGRFLGGEVSTTSGDVSLSLSGSDLELRAETLSGELNAPGAEISMTTGPRRCALRLGEGGRRLHVRSVSGDIEIEH